VDFPVGGECKIVTVTSGKGGVGKTTTSASFAYGLAEQGKTVCAIDFDIGLRNLDLHMGMERRVVFDFVHVMQGECSLQQALIKDRHNPNLFLLAASQTRDKTVLTKEGVASILQELKQSFDYVVCDSPAGIENGAFMAMYFADEAIICTNPELSSVRDSDKMLGLINAQSYRAERGLEPVKVNLLVTRYQADKAMSHSMLNVKDIEEMLGIPLIGVIPESEDVLQSTNVGRPVVCNGAKSEAAEAYSDFVARYLGQDRPFRFLEAKPKGLLGRIFG
jgi:septum site-determining protein MinD